MAELRRTVSRRTWENASLGSFMYVVSRGPTIHGWLVRLQGSGRYYISASSISEASPPSRAQKRIPVARWVSVMGVKPVHDLSTYLEHLCASRSSSTPYVYATLLDVVVAS